MVHIDQQQSEGVLSIANKSALVCKRERLSDRVTRKLARCNGKQRDVCLGKGIESRKFNVDICLI